jgi:hypothetical protein
MHGYKKVSELAKDVEAIDITNVSELLRIAKAVQSSGTPRVLRSNQEDVAVVVPTTPRARRTRRSARPVTLDDPLFSLIGSGHSGIPGGMSDRKHEALARAYRP